MNFHKYNQQIQVWISDVLRVRGVDAAKTLESCELLKTYGLQSLDDELLGFAYYYIGETYYGLNDVELLFENMTKALGYLERSHQWMLVARAYNLLAITSMNRGNAPFAMDYYLSGLTYCNKYDLIEEGFIIYGNIGTLYFNFKDYGQAQKYFDESYRVLLSMQSSDKFYPYLAVIYISLAKCYLFQNRIEKAQSYFDRVQEECSEHLTETDQLYALTFQSRLCHAQGKLQQRDACIRQIGEYKNLNFAIMDLFDEFYEYSLMLFEIKYYDEFWNIVNLLETMAKQAKLMNLQRKLLAQKIQYYKMVADHSGYLQACGLYYELSEIMEKENQYMVSTMLNLRKTLDDETKIRQAVERENEVLIEKSETDALTKLGNRFRLNHYLEEVFPRAMREGRVLAVEILDVDFFKQFNDSYGHQAGDVCLQAVAAEIKKMENYANVNTFRYGGDEFVILYEGYSKEKVSAMMQELNAAIRAMKIENRNSPTDPYVTISQGTCVDIPLRDRKVWDFLHAADSMLYQIKRQSRNSYAAGSYEECLTHQVLKHE